MRHESQDIHARAILVTPAGTPARKSRTSVSVDDQASGGILSPLPGIEIRGRGQEQGILIIKDEVVKAFATFYEKLWNDRRYVNTDKEDVIRKLEEYAKKADELHHASALKTH